MYIDDVFIFIPLLFAVLFFILFRRINKLKERVLEIEKKFDGVTDDLEDITKTTTISLLEEASLGTSVKMSEEKIRRITNEVQQTLKSNGPNAMEKFVKWLKEDWMMKLGGALIVFGMAWFVNYAFENGWVGPMGRIAIGLIIGAFVLGLGRYRILKYIYQGEVLMFAGSLIMVFTVWVGSTDAYGFFTEEMAMVLMFAVSSILGITSVVLKRINLAYANILLAAFSPMFVVGIMSVHLSSWDVSFVKLLTYILVLTLGAIWVSVITGWRQIILISLLVAYFYSWIGSFREAGIIFAFVFTAIFFLFSIFAMLKNKTAKGYDLAIAVISGFFLLTWIMSGVQEEWIAVILEAWSLVFAFGSYLAFRKGVSVNFFYAYSGVSAMFIVVATALQLHSGVYLIFAYLIESLVIIYVGYELTRKIENIPFLSLFSAVPLFMSLNSVSCFDWKGLLNENSFVIVSAIVFCMILVFYFKKLSVGANEKDTRLLSNYMAFFSVVGLLYVLIFVRCFSYVLFGDEFGLVVALLVYSVIGSVIYLDGKRKYKKWERVIGVLLIGVTSAYLFFMAGWILGVLGRVLSYIAIGFVLMFVAWHERNLLYKNKSDKK